MGRGSRGNRPNKHAPPTPEQLGELMQAAARQQQLQAQRRAASNPKVHLDHTPNHLAAGTSFGSPNGTIFCFGGYTKLEQGSMQLMAALIRNRGMAWIDNEDERDGIVSQMATFATELAFATLATCKSIEDPTPEPDLNAPVVELPAGDTPVPAQSGLILPK